MLATTRSWPEYIVEKPYLATGAAGGDVLANGTIVGLLDQSYKTISLVQGLGRTSVGEEHTKEVPLIDDARLRTGIILIAGQNVDETLLHQIEQPLILLLVHIVAAGSVANVAFTLGNLLQGLGVARFADGSSRCCCDGKHEEVENVGAVHLEGKWALIFGLWKREEAWEIMIQKKCLS